MTTGNTITLRVIFDETGLYETPDSKINPVAKLDANTELKILDINSIWIIRDENHFKK